jgi:uncharacterized protein YqgC (DUF456 family)
MNWPLILLQAATATVMVISLFALLIPVYPGLTVIWAAALVYGLLVGFKALGWVAWLIFVVITILMIFGNVIDNIITSKKAYDSGASIWSVIVALIAGVIGAIIWTPIGGLLVAPLALFLAEYYRQREWRKAFESTRGWLVGLGWSFIIRFLTGMAMIGLWLIWALNTP